MESPQRRHRRRRGPLRALKRLNRFRVVALVVAIVAAAAGSAGLVLGLHSGGESHPALGSSPPLRYTPPAGTTEVAAPGTPDTARVVIPAGQIDLAVAPGDGVHVPLNLALHYPGTSWPGGGGNSLFYAHAQPGMFQGLYRLHVGDTVRMIRTDGSQLLYQVRTLHKVSFNDGQVLQQTPFEEVTLLTCTSYNPYSPRFIVTATPA